MKLVIKVFAIVALVGLSGLTLRLLDSIPYFTKAEQQEMQQYIELIRDSVYGETWNTMSMNQRAEAMSEAVDMNTKSNELRRTEHKKSYDVLWTQVSVLLLFIGAAGIIALVSCKRD
ncbi:hypothetical protein JC525_05755 [Alteromonas sp. IB21]|uniref:hypothetical protein n=1 Tax=Alteromonas sp. IB21 TaxID=2779369 RepID=UPI0018E78F28|nr:hypothetical protein [Alteromonas sp. IB21]MBJ2128436.1 hypothetical protein [Alteromonas sp. IB21]